MVEISREKQANVTFGASINILSSVHTFSSKEIFGIVFVSVRISEFNFDEWGTSARVMMDGLDDTFKVSINKVRDEIARRGRNEAFVENEKKSNLPISFSVVQHSEFWSSNSFMGVGLEHTVWSTSSLGYDGEVRLLSSTKILFTSNNSSH